MLCDWQAYCCEPVAFVVVQRHSKTFYLCCGLSWLWWQWPKGSCWLDSGWSPLTMDFIFNNLMSFQQRSFSLVVAEPSSDRVTLYFGILKTLKLKPANVWSFCLINLLVIRFSDDFTNNKRFFMFIHGLDAERIQGHFESVRYFVTAIV